MASPAWDFVTWGKGVPIMRLLGSGIGIAALGFLGSRMVGGPVTCAGQVMRPGDRCIVNGSPASYNQVAGAAVNQWWFWAIPALLLLVYALYPLFKSRKPSVEQAQEFDRKSWVAIEDLQQKAAVAPEPGMQALYAEALDGLVSDVAEVRVKSGVTEVLGERADPQ